MPRSISSFLLSVLLFSGGALADAGKSEPHAERPELPVISHAQALDLTPNLADAVIEGRAYVWRETLRYADAAFVKTHFIRFNLRKGDVLVLRSASGKVVEELTARGPKNRGSFWGLSAFGNTLELELRVQNVDAYSAELPFQIDRVMLGDPAMLEAVTRTPASTARTEPWEDDILSFRAKSICTPADFEDVICYEDDADKWANVLASVGVMNFGSNPTSGLWCSGANVSSQNYILTNDHCITGNVGNDCSDHEFVFKYYRTGCNDGSPTNVDWQTYRCDETVAGSPFVVCEATASTLDFSLHTVIGDPASVFGYAEPDPNPITDGEDIYIVQHPSGRPHEIAHGGGANVDADGFNLRYYDTLDTEGGSSGSPIFRESDDRLVGLHHCGGCASPGTGNRGMLMSDIYPLIQDFVCSSEVELILEEAVDLVQVLGNGDAVLDPGETWQFTPRVRNIACAADALSLDGEIAVNAGSDGDAVILLDTVVQFGTVPAGTVATSTSPIRFQLGEATACEGDAIFDLINLTAASGGPFGDVLAYFSAEIGEIPLVTDLFEDFSGGIPADWTIVDGGSGSGAAQTWTSENPGNRSFEAMSAPFAICDSDTHGSGQSMDEELITAPFAVADSPTVTLQLDHNFNFYSGGNTEQADIDLRSSATGGEWVNIANFSGGDTGGNIRYDITSSAAGQSDVQLRFHYYDAVFEYWWAIDNLYVLGSSDRVCNPFSPVFIDGFESGDTSRWNNTIGGLK